MPAARCLLSLAIVLGAALPAAGQTERQLDDPFARGAWNFQLATHSAFEIWNYNGNHEEMYGFVPGITYGLDDRVALMFTFPMYYVNQQGVDAALQGITFGFRTRLYRRGRVSLVLDADVGWSYADTYTPPRGTRFNYLAIGTVGTIVKVKRGLDLMTGVKLIHVSNNGLAGRERNPDIEALGLQVGVLRRF